MTVEQIERLDAAGAFAPTHGFDDLERYHVPFDDLLGNADTESRLRRLAGNHRRVAVCAKTGEGKSSVISSVVGPLALDPSSGVFPIRIPVGGAADETVTRSDAFLRHLLGTLLKWSDKDEFTRREGREIGKLEAQLRERQETRRAGLTVPLWFVSADIAREVSTTVRPFDTYADHLGYARTRAVETMRLGGREPVFVLDDTDAWLRSPEQDRSRLASAFFSGPLAVLVREVGGGLVVAVHDDYLEMEDVRRTCDLLDATIRLPRLDGDMVAALGTILFRRVSETLGNDVPLSSIVAPSAVSRLAEIYGVGRSLRSVLRVASTALEHAAAQRGRRDYDWTRGACTRTRTRLKPSEAGANSGVVGVGNVVRRVSAWHCKGTFGDISIGSEYGYTCSSRGPRPLRGSMAIRCGDAVESSRETRSKSPIGLQTATTQEPGGC